LESEIRRLREFELSKLRIEEAQKYRQKVQDYRDELEGLQQEKLRELKIRESEAWDRIKNRERDLDKQAFELRQRQLRDEEVLRARENETKKTVEVELTMARNEREALSRA
jgi:oral-facial-digital syndrome 1 protein